MDPLSITTAVVSLTGACLITAKRISDLQSRFNVTSMTLTAILSETRVVSASLGQMQVALLRFSSTFASQFERHSTLLQTLDTALISCSVVILALQEEVGKLEEGLLKVTNDSDADRVSSNLLFKMKILWKEDTMRDLLAQVRNQQSSLGFLLQALNMNSMIELHNLMANNSYMLSQLVESTSALCQKYPSIRAPLSIFETDRDDGVSFFSHTASSAGATEFDFDNFLVESKVYRRAFMGGYLRPRRLVDIASSVLLDAESHVQDDVETITDTGKDREAQESELIEDAESDTESEEAETITDTSSAYGAREIETSTPDTDQWSPGLPEEYKILRVKASDGEFVYMDTKMVEELLQQHEKLVEKHRKLEERHNVAERASEIQDLKNERFELQARLLGLGIRKNDEAQIRQKNLPVLPPDAFAIFTSREQFFAWLDDELAQATVRPKNDSVSIVKGFHTCTEVKPTISCPFCGITFKCKKEHMSANWGRHVLEQHCSKAPESSRVSAALSAGPDIIALLSCSICKWSLVDNTRPLR